MSDNPIIVALDGLDKDRALALAQQLSQTGCGFKVNSLLRREGRGLLEDLSIFGLVMADFKLHDIPNTVVNDVSDLSQTLCEGDFATVHASGGIDMMSAAVKEASGKFQLLAITVLTSISPVQCELTFGCPPAIAVIKLARWAALARMDGIVCSPRELKELSRLAELRHLKKVTPGIRPEWYQNQTDDQQRVMTPKQAIDFGADYIVMGRPITTASDPLEAMQRTLEEIRKG
ncbi:MAG TPA: orotidine-5'-phosphate decarboxylase [Patescibacteria group bacterium]